MTSTTMVEPAPIPPGAAWRWRRAAVLIERNLMIYRRSITPLAFGLIEPIMYLLTIGFGVGSLVGTVPGVDVRYPAYVAPAILATTAMNTTFGQTCFAVFSRIKIEGIYLAIVPTPLSPADIAIGEIVSALLNGLLTSIGFLAAAAILGLVVSPGIVFSIVSAAVVGYAFAAGGLAVTTFVRDFPDFQLIQLFMLPMYLFATTFYPLSTYPRWLQPIIEALPLYQSIVLVRDPALGDWQVGPILFAAGYLLCFGAVATMIATRRLGRKLHV